MLTEIIKHIRDRSYMGGIKREKSRVKATGEVFTPTPLVQEILDKLPMDQFTDSKKTFLDPACGDGQFLSEIIIKKMQDQINIMIKEYNLSLEDFTNEAISIIFEQALKTTYGVDLMPDNVKLCRKRLLGDHEEYRHIVEKNIVCANALTYKFDFNNFDEVRKQLFATNEKINEIETNNKNLKTELAKIKRQLAAQKKELIKQKKHEKSNFNNMFIASK